MSISIVRLGSPRAADEGLRIGTVLRPPRGVKKARHAADDWYDLWFPMLAPQAETVRMALDAASEADWRRFEKQYRREMRAPHPARTLDLLAALSHTTNFAVGCYCADESRCHRRVMRALLEERGASMKN